MLPVSHNHAAFHAMLWTRICADSMNSGDGRKTIEDLCDAYYEPALAFLCCDLRDADAVRNLTH